MIYEQQRNTVIRKYIQSPIHLNWIKLDGNSNPEHNQKVCDICVELREKNLDFLTRPIIEIWELSGTSRFLGRKLLPDIMTWIKQPFKTVVIEVTDTESKDHADNKQYPNEFKVVPVGIDESLEGLL